MPTWTQIAIGTYQLNIDGGRLILYEIPGQVSQSAGFWQAGYASMIFIPDPPVPVTTS